MALDNLCSFCPFGSPEGTPAPAHNNLHYQAKIGALKSLNLYRKGLITAESLYRNPCTALSKLQKVELKLEPYTCSTCKVCHCEQASQSQPMCGMILLPIYSTPTSNLLHPALPHSTLESVKSGFYSCDCTNCEIGVSQSYGSRAACPHL